MSNWTEGTLAYIDGLCKTHHQPTYSEMAAAIMAVTDPETTFSSDAWREAWAMVNSLAEQLRKIGEDNE